MKTGSPSQTAFRLTGVRFGDNLGPFDPRALRPVMFAHYSDLTALRYDFPLVLVEDRSDAACIQTLSAIVDDLIPRLVSAEEDRDAAARLLWDLERQIRVLVAEGETGSLTALWDRATALIAARNHVPLGDTLQRARAVLEVDGPVIDCDGYTARRVLSHAFGAIQAARARAFRQRAERLIRGLADILDADMDHSPAGRTAERLRASVGPIHHDAFDFEIMSRMLDTAPARDTLPEDRRRRIAWALSILRSRRPFPEKSADETHRFVFDDCTAVLRAFRERRPHLTQLAKAFAIAELEVEGRYLAEAHDRFFDGFDHDDIAPGDRALFPDYLVCLRAGDMKAAEHGQVTALLSSELPVKILIQTDDILEASEAGRGRSAVGPRSAQLARLAIGMNEAFVVQCSASNIFRMREHMIRGLTYPRSALISIFSGAGAEPENLPAYLRSAAAMESRAFPAFAWDPSAGSDWASRFSLANNPQADSDWPVHPVVYEDQEHQSISENRAFTFVDFAACDARYAEHFARVPREDWNESMVPADRFLAAQPPNSPEETPYVAVVDSGNTLHRAIVDDRLIDDALRCRDAWRSLQELSGIHNSHAERLLARERMAWTERDRPEPVAEEPAPASTVPAAAASTAQVAQEPEAAGDDPYIETPRCTSCDECTRINARMFAYDANKQAYIANLEAGTYRQLVEAAESCQVSIIHPGKPRDPSEPGLEDLIRRAEVFL